MPDYTPLPPRSRGVFYGMEPAATEKKNTGITDSTRKCFLKEKIRAGWFYIGKSLDVFR
jgi:hypothetical protein